jgi:hypothetical protein
VCADSADETGLQPVTENRDFSRKHADHGHGLSSLSHDRHIFHVFRREKQWKTTAHICFEDLARKLYHSGDIF